MSEPSAVPLSRSAGYDVDSGLHTHPVPAWIRRALVAFSVALLIFGGVLGYAVIQQHNQAADTRRTGCTNARSNQAFYGALLGRLGPNADMVFREQLARQVESSAGNAKRLCAP